MDYARLERIRLLWEGDALAEIESAWERISANAGSLHEVVLEIAAIGELDPIYAADQETLGEMLILAGIEDVVRRTRDNTKA